MSKFECKRVNLEQQRILRGSKKYMHKIIINNYVFKTFKISIHSNGKRLIFYLLNFRNKNLHECSIYRVKITKAFFHRKSGYTL